MKKFLKTIGDKFSDKTTTTTEKLHLKAQFGGLLISAKLRHLSFADGTATLVLDIDRELKYGGLIDIGNGQIIFNINDSININIEANENYVDAATIEDNNGNKSSFYIESAYYELSQELLAQICEAKTLDIKIEGTDGDEIVKGDKFLIYCRKFYNQFYDNTKYPEVANAQVFGRWNRITNWLNNKLG